MKSVTRKISLNSYGEQYGMLEVYVEGEDFNEITLEIDNFIVEHIKKLPEQKTKFEKAKKEQSPF